MAAASLTQKAYRHLQQQLSGGILLPGAVVSEKQVASQLGISRTPVGQAIRQLVSEGLMEQVPRYGTVVKEITRQDIEELYELREAMEPYAARKAAESISRAQLDQLAILCQSTEQLANDMDEQGADALEGDALREFLSTDLAFHLYILRAAANQRMLKIVRDSRFVSRVFRTRRARHDRKMVHAACQCHREIYEALCAHDGAASAERMLRHIVKSKEETLAFIDREKRNLSASEAFFSLDLSEELREQLARLEVFSEGGTE
ncbi:MAG: GntR family transcriptional regulator [Planctomycetales bacterium]|nr:GntR family transcriptional regulator [Planctomycetales bacterium]